MQNYSHFFNAMWLYGIVDQFSIIDSISIDLSNVQFLIKIFEQWLYFMKFVIYLNTIFSLKDVFDKFLKRKKSALYI